ncbi:MAG: hypothetical protein ACPKPY_12205 [Nitrososphaeraceae archaeon]
MINDSGVKLKPEKMIKDKLYNCIYEDKIFLFYKDFEDILYCYEITEQEIISQIKKDPENLENIIINYINSKSKPS